MTGGVGVAWPETLIRCSVTKGSCAARTRPPSGGLPAQSDRVPSQASGSKQMLSMLRLWALRTICVPGPPWKEVDERARDKTIRKTHLYVSAIGGAPGAQVF